MHPAALLASDARVNAVSTAMILLGIVLLVVTVRFWRSAGDDPEVLAPLEVMSDRKFARSDDRRRLEMLNAVRPDGAELPDHFEAPAVLDHEPPQQQRPFRDPFDHGDDAVDLVPTIIDPLLKQQRGSKEQ